MTAQLRPGRWEEDRKYWPSILLEQPQVLLSFPASTASSVPYPSLRKTIIDLPDIPAAALTSFSVVHGLTPASISNAVWAQTMSLYTQQLDVGFELDIAKEMWTKDNSVLLALPHHVLSRRGGGGGSSSSEDDSDGDYGDDDSNDSGSGSSSSSSSSGSSGAPACGNTGLSINSVVPSYTMNYTSYWWRNDSSTDYDGAFYFGEAFFDYTIGPSTNLTKENCPSGPQSIRMLAIAHIGPQTPYPIGLRNSLTLGFRAWPTDYPLENLTQSYDSCKSKTIVRLATSEDFGLWRPSVSGGFDLFDLEVSPAANDANVALLNAAFSKDIPRPKGFDDRYYSSRLFLPAGTCSGRKAVLIGYDNNTVISGSMTNGTMDFTISGHTNAMFDSGNLISRESAVRFPVSYNVSFSGIFNRAESARQLHVNQSTPEELVSFVVEGTAARLPAMEDVTTILWIFSLALFVFYQI
ncbi:uncharacterized protein ACLA_017340 [Aspergillus clavatus NRRL 1]|uniref:Uncharacterized protein n=1 Tax=Aspergillus clavatus (strain ATCC 1007 / CBS 513.65 / DSM 816 / NCTC 3887 / NRRL 1 / QM 1276 / 107) TaxID=344612 RepID=A1CC19_ASPCL|nr:uncharacterized protein ACLA_017340 [Aspergillus clavatus NRRL 1]EAW13287.1 conserved hypothetical protein [Aspergillus clavatus NRRL 1]